MKKSKIIVPALGILVLSTAASITGTVAWFSVNNSVTVDGMAVKTQVSGNLQIAETNSEENYGAALTLGSGTADLLEPTSTVDALSYWYTTDARADGSKEHLVSEQAYTQYLTTSEGLTAFNTAYKTTGAVGYVDYSFYLKAVNPTDADNEIRLTKCNLLYNGNTTTVKAWRIGVFAQGATKNNATSTAITGDDRISILSLSGAQYFEDNTNHNKAVKTATTKDTVSDLNAAGVILQDIRKTAPSYTKVTVRVWLEGEDTNCNNETYASLTANWTIDLQFKMVAETDSEAANAAVTNIGSVGA